jgi:hypothetical protein
VSISAPANGDTVNGPVTINANASDTGGSGVASVTFKVDGTTISTDTSAPFTASWNSTAVPNGNHDLTAVAADGAGNTTTSATVTVNVQNTAPPADTTPPTVSMTAPANGATVNGPSVAVSANAADETGGSGIASVQFQLDGASLGGPVTTAPYSITWDTTSVANGPHQLKAVAKDVAGNSTTSTAVSVTVQNTAPAGISLVSQATASGGSTSTGLTVPIRTTAAGDTLVASFALATGSSKQIVGVSDDKGGMWTKGPVGYQTGSNTRIEVWYRAGVGAGVTSVTATLSAAAAISANVSEWSGVATATPVDVQGFGGNASSTTAATPSLTTLNANDVVIGAINYPGSATSALTTSGFTPLNAFSSGTSTNGRAAYDVVSTTGAYQASWTLSAAATSGGAILALKGASA